MEQYGNPTGIKEFNNFRLVLHTKDGHPTWPGCDAYELQLIDIGHSDKVYVVESDELQAELDDLRGKLKEALDHAKTMAAAIGNDDNVIVSNNRSNDYDLEVEVDRSNVVLTQGMGSDGYQRDELRVMRWSNSLEKALKWAQNN